MSAPPLRSALDGEVLELTLDRPDKRNALNGALVDALLRELERAELDAAVRAVVIRGAGKDFCAGADLAELLASANAEPSTNERAALRLGQVFVSIRELAKPVIAAVHGRALAGGAGLATAADIVVAAESAEFGYPEVQRGFVPAMVMTMLRRVASERIALDLVLTGRILTAREAHAAGLLSRVVPDAELDAEVRRITSGIVSSGPSAVALTKRLFHELDGQGFRAGVQQGAAVNALARSTPEFSQAIARFLSR